MTQKASPSVLLHKSEVTYRDTGVSKNINNQQFDSAPKNHFPFWVRH